MSNRSVGIAKAKSLKRTNNLKKSNPIKANGSPRVAAAAVKKGSTIGVAPDDDAANVLEVVEEINEKQQSLRLPKGFDFTKHKLRELTFIKKSVLKNMEKSSLKDYANLSKIQGSHQLVAPIEPNVIKQLYLLEPDSVNCLLYYIQQNSDTTLAYDYPKELVCIFNEFYALPNVDAGSDEKQARVCSFDDLFVWSLLLYGGKDSDLNLIRFYWSHSKFPLACCFIAIMVFNQCKDLYFIPEDLKEQMSSVNCEMEKMAIELLKRCHASDIEITQDLILRRQRIFLNHELIDLAVQAKSYAFLSETSVQSLLNNIWYETIIPNSAWTIALCLVFPLLTLTPFKVFRSDFNRESKDSPTAVSNAEEPQQPKPNFRSKIPVSVDRLNKQKLDDSVFSLMSNDYDEKERFNCIPDKTLNFRNRRIMIRILRPLYFLNTPVVKYWSHFAFFVLFLTLYSGFLLFDYYPLDYNSDSKPNDIKLTISEIFVIIWIIAFSAECVKNFLDNVRKQQSSVRTREKLKKFVFTEPWSVVDLISFLVFCISVTLRSIQTTDGSCFSKSESCFEAARVFYCTNLILYFMKITQFLRILSPWSSTLIVIRRMIWNLFSIMGFFLTLVVPFGVAYQTILKKTQASSLQTLVDSLNRVYWPLFGELESILNEFSAYQCPNGTNTCNHSISTAFLYTGFVFYTVTCNFLLLYILIATFSSKFYETKALSKKMCQAERYQCIKFFYRKTILPPPLNMFEYFILIVIWLITQCNPKLLSKTTSLHIDNSKSHVEEQYQLFESKRRSQYYSEVKASDKEALVNHQYNSTFIMSEESILSASVLSAKDLRINTNYDIDSKLKIIENNLQSAIQRQHSLLDRKFTQIKEIFNQHSEELEFVYERVQTLETKIQSFSSILQNHTAVLDLSHKMSVANEAVGNFTPD